MKDKCYTGKDIWNLGASYIIVANSKQQIISELNIR